MVNPTRARRRKRRIQPRENLRSRRPAATGPRSGWRKGDWPKGIRASKTRPGHCAGRARPVRWSGYVKQRDRIGRCGSPRSCTTSAALMAKAWCLWLGERSGLTGRLVFDGAGRSRTEQDGAGRSRTEQDGAGRSRTEQDGAGRSRTEQDGAANGLRWAVSSIFIQAGAQDLGLSDSRSEHYTTCPATVKHAERRSAILGDQIVVAVGCTGCVTANRWGCWDVSSRITVPMRMHRTKHYDNQSIGNWNILHICLYFIWWSMP